ncbi:MAG: metallophosphoesterase family protein [Oscillospiraceae bacterium]
MKACRKIAALALCAVLLVSLMPIVFAADAAPALQFDENGEFKILIVADTQDIDKPQKETIALLEAELDAAQPDLVVFLGDQIHGPSIGKSVERTQKALDAFLQPVAERGLQFAVVFGNHDDEGGVSKETQMEYYQSYPGCLAAAGDVTGVGNYNLLVYDSDGKAPVVNLWFFDSGSYAPEGQGKYDWVRQDQIDWYLETEAALAARNGGTPIPAYAFQHIIVPDIYDAMDIVPSSEKKNGAVEGYGCRKGTYYSAASVIKAGTLGEAPCPPDVNGGEFAAWKQGGDIVAGFFGHDHVNDFIIPYEGIDLINTNSTGFYIYGAGENHGARLVTLRESDPTAYETRMLYYKDLIGTKLPFGFAGTWGTYVQSIVLLAVCALVLVLTGAVCLTVHLVKKAPPRAQVICRERVPRSTGKLPGSERSWQGGRAALRLVGSCEFAEDFRENRCILQADRVVRPYGIWEVLKLRRRCRRLCRPVWEVPNSPKIFVKSVHSAGPM